MSSVVGRAPRSGRSTVYAPRGVAATSQPLATGVALQVLHGGGNAIDAAVAAAAVLNVTEPHMTGIGGDMFAILWSAAEDRLVGLDASGRSGSLVDVDALLAEGLEGVPGSGPRSVTVPGALSGWQALVDSYGTSTLSSLLAPAIRIADEGFPVTPIIAREGAETVEGLRDDPGSAATFLVNGAAPRAGAWFRNRDLARSFRRIADDGPDVFYGGALGRALSEGLQELGGYLTLEDLRSHEARWVEPLCVSYRGYLLWELPPAGQGLAALQMLKMLEGYELRAMRHNSTQYLHTLIEAKKLAYADLDRYVADPDHMDRSPEALLDAEYAMRRAKEIDPTRAAAQTLPGSPNRAFPGVASPRTASPRTASPRTASPRTESETVYLTVADRHGNMISFINSIFGHFGARVVVPGTGVMLQNRGAGFTIEEGHPNRIAPRKRPLHTIIPGFVTRDGRPWLSFGVMGGSMQPQGQVQVLLNMTEFGMDPQEAIDAPRFRHLSGASVALEDADASVVEGLEHLGHELRNGDRVTFGGGQAILKLPRGWAAASDRRKDGMAAGH